MADGSRHSLFMVKETTYGATPASPELSRVRITGTTIGLAKDSLMSEETRDDRQISDFRLGANQVGGEINFELSYGSFDALLQAALFSEDWEADTPVVGTQQIKCGVNRASFTFVRYFSDIASANKPYQIYRGCEIVSLSFAIAANAMVTGTMTIIGQSQASEEDLTVLGTPTYAVESTTSPLDSFSGTLNENGSPIAVITEIALELQNNIEPRWIVGSKNTIRPSVQRSNLTGTVTAFFEDASLIDKFINEEESSIDFTMPDTAGNILKHVIPRLKYTGGQPDVAGEGPITLAMPFQALRDSTLESNYAIQRTPA